MPSKYFTNIDTPPDEASHLTLKYHGKLNKYKLNKVLKDLRAQAKTSKGFDLRFKDKVEYFPRPGNPYRVPHIRPTSVPQRLKDLGFHQNFTPHITLSYKSDKNITAPKIKKMFINKIRLSEIITPGKHKTIEEFKLEKRRNILEYLKDKLIT